MFCINKNASKGAFSKKRVWGRRAIELGSGMGLGGMAIGLLGCKEVILTDLKSILPLLQKNVDANLSTSALAGAKTSCKFHALLIWQKLTLNVWVLFVCRNCL